MQQTRGRGGGMGETGHQREEMVTSTRGVLLSGPRRPLARLRQSAKCPTVTHLHMRTGSQADNAQVAGYWASITMVFGSMIAGATSVGGGAVAFPVFTLALGVTPLVARDFSLMIQTVGALRCSPETPNHLAMAMAWVVSMSWCNLTLLSRHGRRVVHHPLPADRGRLAGHHLVHPRRRRLLPVLAVSAHQLHLSLPFTACPRC